MKSLIRRAATVVVIAGSLAIPLAAAPVTTENPVLGTASPGWEFIAAFPTYQQCVDAGAWYWWTQWYCAQNWTTYDLYALY